MEIIEIFNLLLRCGNSARDSLSGMSEDMTKVEVLQNAAIALGKLDIIVGELTAYKEILEKEDAEKVQMEKNTASMMEAIMRESAENIKD